MGGHGKKRRLRPRGSTVPRGKYKLWLPARALCSLRGSSFSEGLGSGCLQGADTQGGPHPPRWSGFWMDTVAELAGPLWTQGFQLRDENHQSEGE